MRTPGKRVCRKATRVRIPAHPLASFVLVLLIISAGATRAAEENVAGVDLAGLARRQFEQGQMDAALKTVNGIEQRSESNARSYILKGRILAEQQKSDEAIAAFDSAYKLDPASSARLHLAEMFVREKKWDDARALYEKAIKETNVLISNERLRYGLLIAALGAQDEERARVAFDSLPFPTESAAYYYAQAAWAFAHGGKSDADKWLRRAEEIFPAKSTAMFARALFDLGWIKTKPPMVAD